MYVLTSLGTCKVMLASPGASTAFPTELGGCRRAKLRTCSLLLALSIELGGRHGKLCSLLLRLAGFQLIEVPGYFQRDGVMYRRWVPQGRGEKDVVEQVVLPKQCRRAVLELTHTIPLGGHLGKKKTAEKIWRIFYWPTLFRDVADFCRSCDQCQKAGHRRVTRVPMMPLPVIAEPFDRIAMDIVGPLPRSRAGHRYVLVVCDYAT